MTDIFLWVWHSKIDVGVFPTAMHALNMLISFTMELSFYKTKNIESSQHYFNMSLCSSIIKCSTFITW